MNIKSELGFFTRTENLPLLSVIHMIFHIFVCSGVVRSPTRKIFLHMIVRYMTHTLTEIFSMRTSCVVYRMFERVIFKWKF